MAHTSRDSAHAEILLRRSSVRGLPVQQNTGISLLRVGEPAYSFLTDPADNGFGNGGDRLYIGTGTENWEAITNGNGDSANRFYSSAIATIGGKYFTDMMNHQRGEVTAASALLVDDNKKLNELLVDFLYFDKDSVSTEATNDLVLRGGTGLTKVTGDLQVTQNVQIDGTLTVDGIATLKAGASGTITMGDQNTDNVVFGADINSSLIPNITDTYDLGTALQRWRTLYAREAILDSATFDNLQINEDLNVEGLTTLDSTTIDGDLVVTQNFTLSTLTDNRVVIVGPNGILEDDANLTFDATTLQVGVDFNVDGLTTLDSTTIDGDLIVNRNLFVYGEQTNISTTELLVEDQQIVIADGANTSLLADGAGIALGDSATPIGYMRYSYNANDPRWVFQPKIFADEIEFTVIDCGTYA